MKRVKHIDLTDLQLIDVATRRVLANHKRRRRVWERLSTGKRTVRQNIQDHADRWSAATGKRITYQQAKKQLFKPISNNTEREQLWAIIALDEDTTCDKNIDVYNSWVQSQIINRSWTPDPYREFYINDGIRRKRRKIAATTIVSQTFHWVLIMAISPVILRGMTPHTCASIPGRGPHYGKKLVVRWLLDEENTKYCAKIDISKFYQSIDQQAAKAEFRRYIADATALWLIDTIIDSYPVGLPIGTYTSQWFANWILQRLDHYIKERLHVKYSIRYMDDMAMFGRNKKELHKVLIAIAEYLEHFGLHIKGNWQVFRVDHIVTESGIFIDKQRRTDDVTQAVDYITRMLRAQCVPYKIISRRKHKDTKRRKRAYTGQEQYKQVFIRIAPEYLNCLPDALPWSRLQRAFPNVRIEYGTRQRHAGRDVDFMGFRFYRDHVTIRRSNALRIRQLYAKAGKMQDVDRHTAAGCLSYLGWPKHTDSHNFTVKYLYGAVSIKELKEVVRNESKNRREAGQGARGAVQRTGGRGGRDNNERAPCHG